MRTMACICILGLMILSGCTEASVGPEETSRFTILYNDRAGSPFSEDWLILQEYQRRKGVTLEVQLGDDGDYERYIIDALEADTPPDVILKVWPDQIEQFIARSLVLPVSDYIDSMPFFLDYIEEHGLQAELEKLKGPDGKFYILPGYQRPIQVQQWVYRRDLFETHGLGVPETYEELFEDLLYLKGIYPDSKPISACWDGAHLYAMMGANYGINAGWAGTRTYDRESSAWRYAPATEAYRKMHVYLHDLYAAGLLDLEHFDQSFEELVEKMTTNRVFFLPTWISSGLEPWNQMAAENGYPETDWAPLPVLESTNGLRVLPYAEPFRKGLVIPAAVGRREHLMQLIRFLDWAVYSPEGRELTTWGVEGLSFTYTETGHSYLPIENEGSQSAVTDPLAFYGLEQLFNLCENEEIEDAKRPEAIVRFLEASIEREETLKGAPPLRLGDLETELVSKTIGKIDAYAKNAAYRFITGELDPQEDWQEYLEELESLGYRTVERIWNGQ